MIIKSLELKNFKSHESSLIELDAITTIIGTNRSGKTNILRALKLILYNENWPKTWIQYGKTSSSIKLTLTNGNYVKRTLTSKGSEIEIKNGKDITSYAGKKDASEAISEVTGVRRVVLDEVTGPEDLNFLATKETASLLSGRADTVQRKICGILGLNAIEDAKGRLQKSLDGLESKLKLHEEEKSRLTNSIAQLQSTYDIGNNLFQSLEHSYTEWNQAQQVLQYINQCLNYIHLNINVVSNLTGKLDELSQFKQVLETIQLLKVRIELQTYLDRLESVQSLYDKINEYEQVQQLLTTINNTARSLESLANTLSSLENDLKTELKRLGICPLCQNKI